MKIGYYGFKYLLILMFLSIVKLKYVVILVGKDNLYGYLFLLILLKLKSLGVEILRIDE